MQTKSNRVEPGIEPTSLLNEFVLTMEAQNKEIMDLAERIKSNVNCISSYIPPSNVEDETPIQSDNTIASRIYEELHIMKRTRDKLYDILVHLERIV